MKYVNNNKINKIILNDPTKFVSDWTNECFMLERGGLIVENRWSLKIEWYAKNTGLLWGSYATCIYVYL